VHETSWREVGSIFSVFTVVFRSSVNKYKICTFQRKMSHWRWLFLLLKAGVCVCVCVDSCTVAGASHYSHLGPYMLVRLWALHVYWSMISHIVSLVLNWWGWGKLVIQVLTFYCTVFCKRIWVMCLLVWLQVLYWSFIPSIAKCTTPNALFYTQVMLLKKWA